MVAVKVVRNGYYHRYILKIEPVRFAEGLDMGMRERRTKRTKWGDSKLTTMLQ